MCSGYNTGLGLDTITENRQLASDTYRSPSLFQHQTQSELAKRTVHSITMAIKVNEPY